MRTLKLKTKIITYISDGKPSFLETVFSKEGIETKFIFPNTYSYEVDLGDLIEAAKEHKKFLEELKS
jgi:hypothetical protein